MKMLKLQPHERLISTARLLGLLISPLLLSIVHTAKIEVNRVSFGKGMDYMRRDIFDSYDIFTNPGNKEFCAGKNSFCKGDICAQSSCCQCQCNASRTFYSPTHGCVLFEDLYKIKMPNPNSVGQGCNYVFYNAERAVIPLFKSNNNALTLEGTQITKQNTTSGPQLSLDNINVECIAGEVYSIEGDSGMVLIDSNRKNGFFEVQAGTSFINAPAGHMKKLLLTTRQYSDWKKLKGKLIRLNIKCVNKKSAVEESSCILFKVNGTSQVNSSTPHTTAKIRTVEPTAGSQATAALSNSVKSSVPVGAIVGGVVAVVLLAVLIVLFILWRKRRRMGKEKTRSSSPISQGMLNEHKSENGNDTSYPGGFGDAPLLSLNKHKDIEMKAGTNPYYKTHDSEDARPENKGIREADNLYYRPADIGIGLGEGPKSPETQNIYYSSADVLDNKTQEGNGSANIYNQPGKDMALPGLTQDYCYARSDSPVKDAGKLDQDIHYKALGNVNPEQDTYQSLSNAVNSKPKIDPKNQEQDNPYYKPAKGDNSGLAPGSQSLETPDPDSRYSSLKNNAGSCEDVSPLYEEPKAANSQPVYQGLTAPHLDARFAPSAGEEYLDMSVGSPSEEYMYADIGENNI